MRECDTFALMVSGTLLRRLLRSLRRLLRSLELGPPMAAGVEEYKDGFQQLGKNGVWEILSAR